MEGELRKMACRLASPVEYALVLGEQHLALNPLIGAQLELSFRGTIRCIHCGRQTRKSYNQGYCFPCSQRLAACDTCIVRPERCHFEAGTCREPEWGLAHCMQPHIVYLASSSGLKVGITREPQVPTRWIDQGAVQALPIARARSRYLSGLMEVAMANHVADKTNWRAMLRGSPAPLELRERRDALLPLCDGMLDETRERFGTDAIELLPDAEPIELEYPVQRFPDKIVSLNFDRTPTIRGRLVGIKGQYLILDSGVLNIRKFTAYHVAVIT